MQECRFQRHSRTNISYLCSRLGLRWTKPFHMFFYLLFSYETFTCFP
jgi:hypothetical protein